MKPARLASAPADRLLGYFRAQLGQFGPQRWWPAQTRLEMILGAILTQNTSWSNASHAIAQLRRQGLLDQARLMKADRGEIEAAIRPAGFFRQKGRTIRNFLDWLQRAHSGSLTRALTQPPHALREALLALPGIGPETADAILLYAANQPFFVADAYTRRILARHRWLAESAGYEEAQQLLHRYLPADPELFNEFHALIVETAKRYCQRRAAQCRGCPLEFDLGRTALEKSCRPPRVRRTAPLPGRQPEHDRCL
jgi:endonuclease-3 related protein